MRYKIGKAIKNRAKTSYFHNVHLKEKLLDFRPKYKDKQRILTLQIGAADIIKRINDGDLGKQINKYIASHFFLTTKEKKKLIDN